MSEFHTVILAGGASSRMHGDRPKALAEIAGKPIIDYLLASLAGQGLTRINIALGAIREPFEAHFGMPVQRPDARPGAVPVSVNGTPVNVRLLDTGAGCDTGGRLGRMAGLLRQTFVLCWCDALWDVNIDQMLQQHDQNGVLVTMLAVHPPGRFGRLDLEGQMVRGFAEKPVMQDEWINGGLFVIEPGLLECIGGDDCSLEREVFPELAAKGQLSAYRHEGLWHCMDTPADQLALDRLVREDLGR